jgi:hypothetical protein
MRSELFNPIGEPLIEDLFEVSIKLDGSSCTFCWLPPNNRYLEEGEVEGILEYAEGVGMNLNVKREGVVFKSVMREYSFKAISNSYLLHKEK